MDHNDEQPERREHEEAFRKIIDVLSNAPGGEATVEILMNSRNIIAPWSDGLQGALERPGQPDIVAAIDAFSGLVRMDPKSPMAYAFLALLAQGHPCATIKGHTHALVAHGMQRMTLDEASLREALGGAEGLEIPEGAVPGVMVVDGICSMAVWPLLCEIAARQGILIQVGISHPTDQR